VSTNINITVGDNALLDAAKLQQQANRQAQLNREASARLEAQATAARTAALATQGRDANGNLITGAPFTQPQIERRPAANRLSGYPVAYAFVDLYLEGIVRVWSTDGLASAEAPIIGDVVSDNSGSSSTYIPGQTWDTSIDNLLPLSVNDPNYRELYPLSSSGISEDVLAQYHQPTITQFFRNQTVWTQANWWIQLPAGKDKSIFFRFQRNQKSQIALNDIAGVTRIYFISGGKFTDESGAERDILTPQNTIISGSVELAEDITLEEAVSCFLVTKTTCRAIKPSAGLLEFMSRASPPMTKTPASYTTDPTYGNLVTWSFGEWSNYPDVFDITGDYSASFRFKAAGFAEQSSAAWFKLMRTPQATIEAELTEYPDYPEAEAFFASEGAPSFALAGNERNPSNPNTLVEHDLTKDPNTQFPDQPTYEANKKGTVNIPESMLSKVAFAAWDWGKPAYCRQQLLALGFSEADLTP
jgi:hypothetical protein